MTTKTKIIIAASALIGAFATGRWMAPEKVKIEKQIVEVEKKSSDKDAEKSTKKTTTTTKVTRPDGSVEETTTVVEETNRKSSKSETSESGKSDTETTEITRGSSKVSVLALGGVKLSGDVSNQVPVYGLSVSKPILGPITVGVWGLSNSIIGASIGLTF